MLWQLPAVALAGAVVVWLLPPEWAPLRGPIRLSLSLCLSRHFRSGCSSPCFRDCRTFAFVGTTFSWFRGWPALAVVTIAGVFAP